MRKANQHKCVVKYTGTTLVKILGLSETRWNGTKGTRLASGATIIYSGQEEDQ